MFKRAFISFLFLFQILKLSFGEDLDYLAAISKSKFYVNHNLLDEAISNYLIIIEHYPKKPEAYLDISYIYHNKGFENISGYYLQKAAENEANFSFDEDKIHLYTELALHYQKSDNREEELKSLTKLIDFSKDKVNSLFYRESYSKAAFLMGMYYTHDDFENFEKYLSIAIQYEYHPKFSSLLLAHSYEKKYEAEQKREYLNKFLYYYRIYNKYPINKNNYNLINYEYAVQKKEIDSFYEEVKDKLFNEML